MDIDKLMMDILRAEDSAEEDRLVGLLEEMVKEGYR